MAQKLARQTVRLEQPPYLAGFGNAVGSKEHQGPLQDWFDGYSEDDRFGQKTWEKAEKVMQEQALSHALKRSGMGAAALDALLAGDLLNQCVASSFAARGQEMPFLGLYGACSTMGEGLLLSSLLLDGGGFRCVAAVTSSHFCTAERQYRTPLTYGSQRTPTAQWTATAAGAVVLAAQAEEGAPRITHVTVGKIVDLGVTDANNMGAAMAPAALDTILAHLRETGRSPGDYDVIVTGDLGVLGRELLLELSKREGVDLSNNHEDCGVLLYDTVAQDVHCGGSGCGCSASVLTGYLLKNMERGEFSRILFCPTGALLSPLTTQQGESIPSICHAVAISTRKEDF